jgi:hypothetical protein
MEIDLVDFEEGEAFNPKLIFMSTEELVEIWRNSKVMSKV